MIVVISKKRKKSQESSVIAVSFQVNSHLYGMLVDAKIRQAARNLFEADDYSVTERTVFLVESVAQRVHRAERRDLAQRQGNIEPHITRDIGIQERLSQSFDRGFTIFDQGPVCPTLCLWRA